MAKSYRQYRKKLDNRFEVKADAPSYLSATIGHPDGTVWVESRKGYCWGRLNGDNGKIIQIWVGGKLLPRYNLPCSVWRPPYNTSEYELVGIKASLLQTSGTGDTEDILIDPNTVGPHADQHDLYGGDTDWIQSQRLLPLLGWPTTPASWYVYVNSGWYPYRDGAQYWPGGLTASLATHLPEDGYRWHVIYINAVTNTLAYVDSEDLSAVDTLTVQNLIDLLPADSIPICGVLLLINSSDVSNTQDLKMVYDLRLLISPILGDSITGAFGNKPANTFFGGPVSGVDAAPAFRALVDADIPDTIARRNEAISGMSLYPYSATPANYPFVTTTLELSSSVPTTATLDISTKVIYRSAAGVVRRVLPGPWRYAEMCELVDFPLMFARFARIGVRHADTTITWLDDFVQTTDEILYSPATVLFSGVINTGVDLLETDMIDLYLFSSNDGGINEVDPDFSYRVHFGTGTSLVIPVDTRVIAYNGTAQPYEPILNFTGLGVTVADNPTTNSLDVTINSSSQGAWYNVLDYGADGTLTNDDAALVAIRAAMPAEGGVIYFPTVFAGMSWPVSGDSHVFSKPTIIRGDSGIVDYTGASGALTRITCASATGVVFEFASHGCGFQDVMVENTAVTTPTAGSAFLVSSGGDLAKYRDSTIKGFYDNIVIHDGAQWVMDGVYSLGAVRHKVYIRHDDYGGDFGDWSISNCVFKAEGRDSVSGVRVESGGGGKFINNKFNGGLTDYGNTAACVDIAFAAGMSSGIFLFSNNSIENSHGDGIRVVNAAGQLLHSIQITNNEFGFWLSNTGGHAISIAATALGLIPQVLIGSNTFRAGTPSGSLALGAAISLTNITNIALGQYTNENWPSIYSLTNCTNISQVLEFDPLTVADGSYTRANLTLADGVVTAIANGSDPEIPHVGQHIEVAMTGATPPTPIENVAGTDWVYGYVYD